MSASRQSGGGELTHPELDIAAEALFLPCFRGSSGEAGTATSTLLALGFLLFRLSRGDGGDGSDGALRLREAVDGVAAGGEGSGGWDVVERSAWSLAAARVTLFDMGKLVVHQAAFDV